MARLVASLTAITCSLAATACPDDTVRLVVGYSAGGTGGIVATALAEPLGRDLNQKIVVDYQPGDSGSAAARIVSKAVPDGCTLLLGQSPEIAINTAVNPNLGYDPAKDLQPVALVATVPLALVVASAAPYPTIEALVETARAARPILSFASAGRSTPSYYAGELLRLRTRAPLAHATYDGGGVALQAVIKGQVSLYFPALSTAMDEAGKGTIRILAISSPQRSQAVPQVPTLDEAGLSPFRLDLWLGVFMPHGASPEAAVKLNKSVNTALLRSEFQGELSKKGLLIAPTGVDQFKSFVKNERDKYKDFLSTEFCAACPW